MESVTFSDSMDNTDDDSLIVLDDCCAVVQNETSLEAYCKRYPDAAECREYDV